LRGREIKVSEFKKMYFRVLSSIRSKLFFQLKNVSKFFIIVFKNIEKINKPALNITTPV